MPEEKTKQAGWAYTFLYPNAAAKYNEEQRKLKRKGDDIKLHKMYKLIFDIEKREFLEACRTVLNDRERAKIKSTEEYLPLHLAIYARAPLQLLEILIEAYPAALQQRDPQSLLCIHIAVRDNTVLLPILRTLVQCFPACLRELDPAGDLPIHSALRNRLPKEVRVSIILRRVFCAMCSVCQVSLVLITVSVSRQADTPPSHFRTRPQAIIELLDFHPESLHVCDSQNNTLLHMALRFNGHDELIENLVKRKPEVRSVSTACCMCREVRVSAMLCTARVLPYPHPPFSLPDAAREKHSRRPPLSPRVPLPRVAYRAAAAAESVSRECAGGRRTRKPADPPLLHAVSRWAAVGAHAALLLGAVPGIRGYAEQGRLHAVPGAGQLLRAA